MHLVKIDNRKIATHLYLANYYIRKEQSDSTTSNVSNE